MPVYAFLSCRANRANRGSGGYYAGTSITMKITAANLYWVNIQNKMGYTTVFL
jgi:hypothetical protein